MRVRLFNQEYPMGKLFIDPDELARAERKEDWWDEKGKVGQEPSIKELIAKPMPEPKTEPTNVLPNPQVVKTTNPKVEKLCACGCGTPVKNKYVQGHWLRKK